MPGPVNTVRGSVEGHPGSVVSGGLVDEGLIVTVLFDDGTRYWIEPLGDRVPDAPANLYVSYLNDDVMNHVMGCGTQTEIADEFVGAGKPAREAAPDDGGGETAGSTIFCAELACDADVQYFNSYGSVSAVENRINLVINTVNVQYEGQTDIRHVITTILVPTAEPDPYTSSSSDALLCEFITEWTNNQQGIAFDVAKLFTGRSINGGIIGQAATIGDICDRQGSCGGSDDGAFCYSWSDCCGSFAWVTDLCSHELGHLWNAFHCSCPNNTMNAFIGSCNNVFTNGTVNSIVAHRNARNCLDQNCDEPVGFCDDVDRLRRSCNNNGNDRLIAILDFVNSSHSGETVTFDVDGVEYPRTVSGNKARLDLSGFGGTGVHTISIVECPGVSTTANCN